MKTTSALQNLIQLNTEIWEEDFRKGILGWKETTSTSRPSGRHLGHYKVACIVAGYLAKKF